ncbi:long-chain-fatty-acid--CoA ligase ACSBG2 [Lepeophtheirus salmonis]|uniref:long-chain-fatty-acid--CoA ligase n=1 Tax=Lepeophtheirus salmonis TaxID=72036 RepID=A0A0K2V7C9_LEPSM|nr:long-chain-fatty-acid--CoA ligase ACSBG2-like [Lepeophtheirus salmonis]
MKGPDRLLDANSYTNSDPNGAVKLRSSPDSILPLSVPTLLKNASDSYPKSVAMAVKRADHWNKWTYKEYYEEAQLAAEGFIELGLEPFHSVGILGFNAPEWSLSLVGAIFAGGFGAGIYATNSAEAVKYVANDCRVQVLVVEDSKQLQKVNAIKEQLTFLKAIIVYGYQEKFEGGDNIYSWREFMDLARNAQKKGENVQNRLENISINQCCSLIYTSGTTGPPKGVMMSHDNVTWTARTSNHYLGLKHGDRGVSYLPLSHSAAQMMDIWMPIAQGMSMYFCDRNALKGSLVSTLREVRPAYFFGVPRVYEKIEEKMRELGKANTGFKKAFGEWAKKTGLNHNMKSLEGQQPGGISYPLAKKLIFKKVKEGLGLDKARMCGIGAAPVSRKTLEYFLSLDIPLYDCYGMSESSGPQTGNRPGNHRFMTVGGNVGGCVTKIYEPDENGEGEICMSSRNVMMGYLFDPEKTKEAIDKDDWLHSGDIGKVDADGYFKVTGRIKELIITAGGENVPPVLIEDIIKMEIPLLSNAMVIGDKKKFLSCLLTLRVNIDPDTMEPSDNLTKDAIEMCSSISPSNQVQTVSDFLKDPVLMDHIQKGIDRVNSKATSNAQKIQKFVILNDDFSVSGGELGPTLKLKRHFVANKYDTQIRNFYNLVDNGRWDSRNK